MKGNVHSSCYELKTRPWSHSGDSTILKRLIAAVVCSHTQPSLFGGLDKVSGFICSSHLFFLHVFPPFCGLISQSARETKAASHVLQTVWSYKELRNALTKDGWNKSHFQVQSLCNLHMQSGS